MSFDIRFHAKDHQSASDQIEKSKAPECVKDFLRQAISALNTDQAIQVIAYGHLYDNDYVTSTCTINVQPYFFAKADHENEE